MSFKQLAKSLKGSATPTKRLDIDAIGFPVIVRAATIDEQIGIANGHVTPSEFISRCTTDEHGEQMSPARWREFLAQCEIDVAGEIITAINSLGGDTDGAKKP